ncbi:hypothetical protein [Corynebacterium jeikeium]|uniref:hypothetical protein n=1 Tax=Corynebacterium jeikeium TaxID=38289 RepID=UPI0005509749|nr:hypothetical protein [Corynebacterium jeikeium]
MKSLRINRGVIAGAAAVSLLFTATGVAAPSLLPQAAAETKNHNLDLKCSYTAPLIGTKEAGTTGSVAVDMPNEVEAGADIPVKVSIGESKISSLAFGAVSFVEAKSSTARLQVSPNAELVGNPAGVALSNGVLSVSNVLSASKTSKQEITVSAKPAEFSLRSKDGQKVTVSAPSDIIEVTMGTPLGEVPTKCTTTAAQLNETNIKAAPAPEPEPNPEPNPEPQPDPDQPAPDPKPNPDPKPEDPKPEDPKPEDPKDPESSVSSSSKEGILAFFQKIFGIDKSDEAKETQKTFWLSLFGAGVLGVLISCVMKFFH